MIVIKTIISIVVFAIYNFFLISLFALPYILIIFGIYKYVFAKRVSRETMKTIYYVAAFFAILTINWIDSTLMGLSIRLLWKMGI